MAKPNIITGLDIGTSAIKVLVAGQKKDTSDFEVLYQAKEPSFGVRKGVVVDVEKISRIIQVIFNKIRTETGFKIDSVYTNISGSHILATSSRGLVSVSRADQRVSEEDVERVLQAAQTFSMPSNKEVLEVFPREYIVDGENGIKEPVGMQGVRLEAEVLALSGFSPYKNNLVQAILNSGLQILDIIPSPLASASAVLSQRQKELGVGLLDIGAGTSELAVFEEGNLVHLAIIPIGSSNITNDIAIGLKTDIDTAEAIKIERGCCIFKGNDKKEKIQMEDEEVLSFSQKNLTKIIEPRVSEIFDEVQKELKKISKQGMLPSGIVLTGGGAKLSKIAELAKKEFRLPCRLGKPPVFSGLEEELAFSTVCGLILRGIVPDGHEPWHAGKKSFVLGKRIGEKIKKIFKIFIP